MAKKTSGASGSKSKTKPAGTGDASAVPAIDTNAAAAAAARMIGARSQRPSNPQSGAPAAKAESSLFKQLKAGTHKPSGSGGTLGSLAEGKKPAGQSRHPDKQRGHGQTFGVDSSRTYIPRRTSG